MTKRDVTAFVLAPLVTALIVIIVTPIERGTFSEQLFSTLATMFAWYFGAVTLTAVLAVPAFIILRRMNMVRWWSALAMGLVIGFIATLIVGTPTAHILQGPAPLSIVGGASGLIFWFIWKPRRSI
jgi:hypothetical protein